MKLKSCAIVLLLWSMTGLPVQAQRPTPQHRDVSYDTAHPAQKLDVYLAKSDKPLPVMIHIHGGGWQAGSKNSVPAWLFAGLNESTFHVVSIEYRFTQVETHPAQTDDCMHAIQYVRAHAKEWNIDPTRLGVTGGSAGGHLSLWVSLHDDIADPDAADAIAKQSSRVSCCVSFAGPTDWSLLHTQEHRHPAYRMLLGYKPGTEASEMDAEKMTDVSPISFVSSDDPPVLLVHGDADDIVPIQHAKRIHQRLKSAGVDTTLHVVKGAGHGVAGAGGKELAAASLKFVTQHLTADE